MLSNVKDVQRIGLDFESSHCHPGTPHGWESRILLVMVMVNIPVTFVSREGLQNRMKLVVECLRELNGAVRDGIRIT